MIIEKLKGIVRYLAYNDYATELDNLRLENKRLREKLRMYKGYLRAANKGAECNAMVSQLSAARNSQLWDRIRELQKRPEMYKPEKLPDGDIDGPIFESSKPKHLFDADSSVQTLTGREPTGPCSVYSVVRDA